MTQSDLPGSGPTPVDETTPASVQGVNLKKLAINIIVVLATFLLAVLLWEFHHAVIMFVFSLAVAASARPFVERLNQRGLPRIAALILTYVLAIGLIALILVLIGTAVGRELQVLTDNLARAYDQIWQTWPKGTDLQKMIAQQLPAPADLYANFSIENQDTAMQTLMGVTLSSFTLASDLVAILILSLYWSIDQVHFERLWLSVLPVESRARYRDMWRDIERDFGSHVRSEVLQSLIAGLLLGAGFWAMGLPYPTLLALFGALVWLIPWLGGILVLLPVALVGFGSNLWLGIFASLYAMAILFFLEFFVEARFLRHRQYSSILSIVLMLILSKPFGLFGLLAAPPLAAAVELVFRYNLQSRTAAETDESVERIVKLREKVNSVRGMVNNNGFDEQPQTASMLARLEGLVDDAERIITDRGRNYRESQRVRAR